MGKVHTGDNLHTPKGKSSLPQKSFSQRMKILLASAPFLIWVVLGQGCSNEPSKVVAKNVNPGTTTSLNKAVGSKTEDKTTGEVTQKKEWGDIVSLHSLMLWDEKVKVVIKKEDLDKMYQTYTDARSKSLWPNGEKYTRSFLLSVYIGMLKEGYEINWYKELDDLMVRIPLLSDWELTVKTWKWIPQISEFTWRITVVWEKITEKRGDKIGSRLFITERGGGIANWGANTNEVSIMVDPKEFFKLSHSDLSSSVEQSEKQIAEINNKFILEQEKLRVADNTVEIRDFQIAELKKDIDALEKEKKKISDKAIADAGEAKKEALRIKWLTDTALKDEQARLQGLFTAKEKELSWKIATLNTEIWRLMTLMETQRGTFETNRQALKKTTDEINKEVVTLSNRITTMEGEATKNKTTIVSQGIEVARLSGENKALKEEKLALAKKHEKEMADFQLKLILK